MRGEKGKVFSRLLMGSVLLFVALAFWTHAWVEPVYALDSDNDYLSDSFENAIGTDPGAADSDQDGWDDFQEVYVYGTDPNLPDTDGDGQLDPDDTNPLDDGTDAGGRTNVSTAYDDGCDKPNLQGTTPIDQGGVNVITGEKITTVAVIHLGRSYGYPNAIVLREYSDIDYNGPWGKNVKSNLCGQIDLDATVTLKYLAPNGEWWTLAYSGGVYVAPDGLPVTATVDTQAGTVTITWIRGGEKEVYSIDDGWLESYEDLFGNETEINRNGSGEITSMDLPEGNSVIFTTYGTGRYQTITGWASISPRVWTFVYNCYDELSKVTDPVNRTTQYST